MVTSSSSVSLEASSFPRKDGDSVSLTSPPDSSTIHNTTNSTHNHDSMKNTTTTSPEAAGILRGASRTIVQSLAKRTNQIRKSVVQNSGTVTNKAEKAIFENLTLSSWKFPNVFKNKFQSKKVAQVSDRMSVGMDLVHVALEQQDQHQQLTTSTSTTNPLNHTKGTNTTISLQEQDSKQGKVKIDSFIEKLKAWPWKHYRETAFNITYSRFLFQKI